jgi:hypothetical protein
VYRLNHIHENDDLKERKVIIMSRTGFATFTILVTLVLGAGESSTALAHEFIVNGSGIKEAVEVEGTGGVGLEGSIAKITTHIGCGEGRVTAGSDLLASGSFKTGIELKACGLNTVSSGVEEDQAKCQVANFTVEGLGSLTEAGIASVSGRGTENTFATIVVSEVTGAGTCTLAGKYELRGTTSCIIPDELVTSPGFLIGCDPLGNKGIKLGTEPVKLSLDMGIEGAKGQTFSSN